MSIRTPIARVRGHGSARSGTGHFWHQRLTAVANVPLVIGFIIILVSLLGRSHAAVVQILGSPLVAIVMLLFIGSITYHMRLGMQVIIEDYVHDERWRLAGLIASTFFAIAIAAACGYAILKLSFGV
jgi:succinate dehydrogenase / fumarate reductase membrane anchor subunit